MRDKNASISLEQDAGHAQEAAAILPPAEVDYIIALSDVENPLDLEELRHRKVMYVYKVLHIDGEIVQWISIEGCSIVDDRYLIN